MTTTLASVTDRSAAEDFLRGGRNKDSRTIARNTKVERRGDDVAIRLHATDVVVYHADGTISLHTGGWNTVTTKDRINEFIPNTFRVYSARGRWFLYEGCGSWNTEAHNKVPFYDGIRFDPSQPLQPEPKIEAKVEQENAENAALNRLIERYLKGLTTEKLAELLKDAQEHGSAGDCLFCHAGSDFGGTEHLVAHLNERYYMITLTLNALKAKGYRDPVYIIQVEAGRTKAPTMCRRALRTYFRKQLTQGAVSVR